MSSSAPLFPEELSALVLRSLKADAEAALGERLAEAIISVPAYFSDAQRKATRAASWSTGFSGRPARAEVEAAASAAAMTAAGRAYGTTPAVVEGIPTPCALRAPAQTRDQASAS